ncbi:DNA mismatch repair endonuclease MutL [Ligilactobacillus sp. LYQ135]
MGKIHELPAILADQIAAGEVVERPASVVKELAENAIDAQSTQIDILVEDAGLKRIQIIDNGIGIEDDDVEIAFQRHATSKIQSRDDLFRVWTLGFRGEALPSIASIAEVTLETMPQGQKIGSKLHIKGGEILAHDAFGGKTGTRISVEHLFYNTPARLKYLSSPQTELSVITDTVNRLALAHPEISFSLVNNGKTLLKTLGNGNLLQVVSAIYGVANAKQMIAFSGRDADFEINGLTSLPKLTRASKNYINILLNGRAIKNNQLAKAIIKGYGSKLMVGRYPISVLNIKLDPLLVDVNVHPTKQEVRISKEEQLTQLISKQIYEQIAQENLIPNAVDNLKTHKRPQSTQLEISFNESNTMYESKQIEHKEVLNALLGNSSKPKEEKIKSQFTPQYFDNPLVIKNANELTSLKVKKWDTKYVVEKTPNDSKTKLVSEVKKDSVKSTSIFPNLKYIGQLHGTYLLAEADEEFYIVDQHAAQERVKYEYYREEIGNITENQQKMLIPLVLTYSASEAFKIEENKDKLLQLGIHLEDFGQNTYIVHEHPAWIPQGNEEQTIRDLIDACLQNPKLTISKFRKQTAIMISCKQSIKANHHLETKQAVALLKQLKECQNPFNCPHGRPTVVEFTNTDLEKMFKRIQDSHRSLRDVKNSGD